jgi:acetyltransferase-like isoleucine patch superfamily enzyme
MSLVKSDVKQSGEYLGAPLEHALATSTTKPAGSGMSLRRRLKSLPGMKLARKMYDRVFPSEQFGLLRDCETLKRFEIGEWTHGHFGLTVLSPEGGTLRIGRFCSIARGVKISLGGEHRSNWISTYAFPALLPGAEKFRSTDFSRSKGDVTIGNDVWVGIDSIIMSGVTLADGMIVGAGSVVRRSFPPYSIVAGNPASLAGYRFPKEIIDELVKIRWWDWPLEKIREALPLMLTENVEQFVNKYRVSP